MELLATASNANYHQVFAYSNLNAHVLNCTTQNNAQSHAWLVPCHHKLSNTPINISPNATISPPTHYSAKQRAHPCSSGNLLHAWYNKVLGGKLVVIADQELETMLAFIAECVSATIIWRAA